MAIGRYIQQKVRRLTSAPVRDRYPRAQQAAESPAIAWADRYAQLQGAFAASLHQHFGTKHDADELIRHAVDGSIKLIDATTLAQIIHQDKPVRILEVGSFLGFSTRWILEASAHLNARVTSLDPRVRHRIFDDVKGHLLAFCGEHAPRLVCIDAYLSERNDAMFLHDYLKYSPVLSREDAMSHLAKVGVITDPFDTFDFAFVDGDHGFQATILNVHLVARMLPAGARIVVHDAISWPDVVPALRVLCTESTGLQLKAITGTAFRERFDHSEDLQLLTDGLGIVKVIDPERVAATDPRAILRAARK
jgi:predicted O-methyltransferase YrrM